MDRAELQAGRELSESPSGDGKPATRRCPGKSWVLPSGKRLHNYRKSPFLMVKSTIKWQFSIAMLNYQRVSMINAM